MRRKRLGCRRRQPISNGSNITPMPQIGLRMRQGSLSLRQAVNRLTGINDAGQIVGEFGGNVLINGLDWEAPNIFLLNQGTFTPLSLPVADAQVTWSYKIGRASC